MVRFSNHLPLAFVDQSFQVLISIAKASVDGATIVHYFKGRFKGTFLRKTKDGLILPPSCDSWKN